MIDENLEPFLIEVNRSPSWVISNDKYKYLKENLFYKSMDLVLKIHQEMDKTHE